MRRVRKEKAFRTNLIVKRKEQTSQVDVTTKEVDEGKEFALMVENTVSDVTWSHSGHGDRPRSPDSEMTTENHSKLAANGGSG